MQAQISLARMKLSAVPKLVGATAKRQFVECAGLLTSTRWPLYFIGPSGSGKTIMAMNLAKWYAENEGVPAYYIQLSPDQTKTSVILGLRLIDGSLVPVDGVVSRCMQEGGILIVDEATHSTQEMLLMFNSILDPVSVTSIGDRIVYARKTFRVIFCSNDAHHAGNVRLPQSFAQRLCVVKFDYPDAKDEVRVAARIIAQEYVSPIQCPPELITYLTAYIREYRTSLYPLSARNVAIAVIRCEVTHHDGKDLDTYFTMSNAESIRRKMYDRIYGKLSTSTDQLFTGPVMDMVTYISKIGVEKFRKIVTASMLVDVDIDGTELTQETIRQKLDGGVI